MRFLPQFVLLSLLVALGTYAVLTLAQSREEAVPEVVVAGPPGEVPTPVPKATAPIGPAPPQEEPATGDIIERFKLADGGPLLLVPVQLKGKTFQFILDTGASSGIFDSSLAPLLGDPISVQEIQTPDGVTRGLLFPSPDAKLGE
jgi:hypothetical protein